MQEFLNYLTGGNSLALIAAAIVMAIGGIALSAFINTSTRKPLADGSPVDWSWKYFWKNNLPRLLNSFFTGALVVFFSIRFSKELFGKELSMFFAFGLGLGLDQAIIFFKKRKSDPIN